MAKTYPMKPNDSGYIRIQFYDGRSASEATEVDDVYPALLELKYFGSLPELKEPRVREELVMYKDRGSFVAWNYDEDTMDIPEVTFNCDIVDDQVTGTGSDVLYKFASWFQQFAATDTYGATPVSTLISTNTGSNAYARKPDGSTQLIGIPAGLNTLGMRVLFDNGVADKAFGFDYPCVEIRDSSVAASDMLGKFSFTVKVWSVGTDVQEVLSQTTVTE